MNTKRTITVITAGGPDWEPTTDELQALIENFIDTSGSPGGSVVALPADRPVNVRVVDVTASEGLLASTGWLSDEDITACVAAFNAATTPEPGANPSLTPTSDGVQAFRIALDQRMSA